MGPGEWDRPLAPGGRTIREIAAHCGVAKFIYADFAWGEGGASWDERWAALPSLATAEETVAWLREGQQKLLAGVAGMSDETLDQPLRVHWDDTRSARQLATMLARHDVYHAGEINFLRSVLQGTDRWDCYGD